MINFFKKLLESKWTWMVFGVLIIILILLPLMLWKTGGVIIVYSYAVAITLFQLFKLSKKYIK